jgi:hypothetical protein
MQGLIDLKVCPIRDVPTPLNCYKVSVSNSYKAFTRKKQNDTNTHECLFWLID